MEQVINKPESMKILCIIFTIMS